jgi:hypothetical protein
MLASCISGDSGTHSCEHAYVDCLSIHSTSLLANTSNYTMGVSRCEAHSWLALTGEIVDKVKDAVHGDKHTEVSPSLPPLVPKLTEIRTSTM